MRSGLTVSFALAEPVISRDGQARALHVPFYTFYVDQRITGTMSHWMTFAGQEMVVLLMLVGAVLFGTALFWAMRRRANVRLGPAHSHPHSDAR